MIPVKMMINAPIKMAFILTLCDPKIIYPNKNPKKIYYKASILGTTIYNYKELSKLYKE